MIIYTKCHGSKLEIGERETHEGHSHSPGSSCLGGRCSLHCLHFLLLEKFMNPHLNTQKWYDQ